MKPIKKPLLAFLAGVCLLCSYLFWDLTIKLGYTPLFFHPILALLTGVGAATLGYCGWQVRRLKERKATWLRPTYAPYVVLVAQAAAIWSALLLGYLGGQLLVIWEIRHAMAAEAFFWQVLVLLLATLGLEVVALLVEYWCRIDPNDLEQDKNPGPNPSAAFG